MINPTIVRLTLRGLFGRRRFLLLDRKSVV